MLSRETLEMYRRMTLSERLKLVLEMCDEAEKALIEGPPEVVERRFELLRRQNDERNRRMLEGLALRAGLAAMSLAASMRDFVGVFERLGLPYAVMGGLAVRAYGIPRPTYDVDFTVALPRERLGEFYKAAISLGYTVAEPYLTGWVDRVAGMPVVKLRRYIDERGIDVDLFLAECDFQKELLARRREVEIDGGKVWMVSPEDLILLKLLAARPRDIADIGDVLFTQGRLDQDYMRAWARRHGTLEGLEKLLVDSG